MNGMGKTRWGNIETPFTFALPLLHLVHHPLLVRLVSGPGQCLGLYNFFFVACRKSVTTKYKNSVVEKQTSNSCLVSRYKNIFCISLTQRNPARPGPT